VNVDWSECPLVESEPEVPSGSPVLRGTRMPADSIIDNANYGVTAEEIEEQFEIAVALVEAVITYAKSHCVAHLV